MVPMFQGVEVPFVLIVHKPFPRFIVLVAVPEPLNPVVLLSVTLLLFALKSSVPVNAPHVIAWQEIFPVTVTVPPPDAPSKIAASFTPGPVVGVVPPPLAVPQWADEDVVPSQLPVPPNQKRFAIAKQPREGPPPP